MLKVRDLPGIFLLALLWSPTFLIVRIGVHEMPPITLTFLRLFFGALALLIVCAVLRKNLIAPLKYFWRLLATAIVLTAIPFSLCSIGEVHIDSSTAGIIEGSTPIFTLLFAHFLFRMRDIDKGQIVSICLAFMGLLVIFVPSSCTGDPTTMLGFFLIVAMAAFFGFGFVFSEKYLKEVPAVESTTIQMVLAALILFPVGHLFEVPLFHVQASFWILFLVFCLGAIGTSAAWITYFKMVKRAGARNVSLATMIMPIFSLIWGAIFLNEPISWYKIIGIVIVLGSVFSMSLVGRDLLSRLVHRSNRDEH